MSSIFDVNTQLTFYGAYHNNKINILIHVICVPLIMWSAMVLLASAPHPSFLPEYHQEFNKWLVFELNYPAILFTVYETYYFILEPVAALLYAPQFTLSLLTATAFAQRSDHLTVAITMQTISWIAQFLGHGVAEKRAPALLDNLVGALVLAPFFVHLEILFALGYRPDMHKRLVNDVGTEIARIKKIEGDKRRSKSQ
ncbi:duf962 domain-containing protein [Lentinula edodes]|uniref:Duf962 domain-containing protein n=1 Tax=Lentinula edodes TaxID=5353 RepID=A0A1Q3DWR4_LENED|nr:uncharacterized protein C8R40DRAFT_805229 [Lentinula edodes]KAH7868786.1 hypothetical protein C8R40DRAFT_805229 [Lentinula edodes]KAJ3922740.1 hypothetical protein F5877DRAFT_88024 [Lentinula edodes]GAV99444.1 duf962 domain-containing protein [Lentinula edodes]